MEKKFKPKENGVQLPWNDEAFMAKWQEWLQFRRENRWTTYKPTGLKQTFKRLILDSGNNMHTAIEMIDHAMARNWMGIFPIKQPINGKDNKGYSGEKPVPHTVHQGGFGQL